MMKLDKRKRKNNLIHTSTDANLHHSIEGSCRDWLPCLYLESTTPPKLSNVMLSPRLQPASFFVWSLGAGEVCPQARSITYALKQQTNLLNPAGYAISFLPPPPPLLSAPSFLAPCCFDKTLGYCTLVHDLFRGTVGCLLGPE